MNTFLLIGLAVGETIFAGLIVYEFYCLLRWLDRRVCTPLLQKVNDLALKLYARQVTEEWLFWEGRRDGHQGAEGVPGLREAGDDPVRDADHLDDQQRAGGDLSDGAP